MSKLVYGTHEYETVKAEILSKWAVTPTENFDVKSAVRGRIDYLKNFLRKTGQKGYVLGISGGVDSSTVGRLAQIACEELRAEGYDAKFIAMRLPAGVQFDEEDAQKALKFINPDMTLTVNVGEASKLISTQCSDELNKNNVKLTESQVDFHTGNVKARVRAISQYFVAGANNMLVLSSSNPSEEVMGFFTKYGDGATDLMVLASDSGKGVNKRQIRLMAKELGAPESVYVKIPTADLLENNPGLDDATGMGLSSYDVLDDFIEGKYCPPEDEVVIVNTYNNTRHKRDPIPMY